MGRRRGWGQAVPTGTTRRGRGPGADQHLGIAIVGLTVVLVAVVVIGAGLSSGALWAFEVLAAAGALVGLGIGFGVLDRRWVGGTSRGTVPVASSALDTEVAAELARLDPVEHRALELGTPWPAVVVGPTGVAVVTVVAGRLRSAELDRVRAVVTQLRRALARGPAIDEVTVRGLAVVAVGGGAPVDVDEDVRVLDRTQLRDALARGSLVPMTVVQRAFHRVSGAVAPDLHEVV